MFICRSLRFIREPSVLALTTGLTAVLESLTPAVRDHFRGRRFYGPQLRAAHEPSGADSRLKVSACGQLAARRRHSLRLPTSSGRRRFSLDGDLQHDPPRYPCALAKIEEGTIFASGWRKQSRWIRSRESSRPGLRMAYGQSFRYGASRFRPRTFKAYRSVS